MFRQTRVWRTRTNPDCLTFALAFDVRKSFENIPYDVCRKRRLCVCVSVQRQYPLSSFISVGVKQSSALYCYGSLCCALC